jgi:hypothetical protein
VTTVLACVEGSYELEPCKVVAWGVSDEGWWTYLYRSAAADPADDEMMIGRLADHLAESKAWWLELPNGWNWSGGKLYTDETVYLEAPFPQTNTPPPSVALLREAVKGHEQSVLMSKSGATAMVDGVAYCSRHYRIKVQWLPKPPPGFGDHVRPCPVCFPACEGPYLRHAVDAGGPVSLNGRTYAEQDDGSWLYVGSKRPGVMGDEGTRIQVLPRGAAAAQEGA